MSKSATIVIHFPPARRQVFDKRFFNPGRTVFYGGTIHDVPKDQNKPDENPVDKTCGIIRQLAEENPRASINFIIASPGGDVGAGLKLLDGVIEIIDLTGVEINTMVVGGVSSMGAVLAAILNQISKVRGGEREGYAGVTKSRGHRYILENALLMFHGGRYGARSRGTLRKMRGYSLDLNIATDMIFNFLALASGKTKERIEELISGSDLYYNSKEAVLEGFADAAIMPYQYYGFARPGGMKIVYHAMPSQRTKTVVVERTKNVRKERDASEELPSFTLAGYSEPMHYYQAMGGVLYHFSQYPDRDLVLNIVNSPGGAIDEGLGFFDIIRLINANPNCGNILTYGKGSIGGISALIFSAGLRGERAIHPSARLVLPATFLTVSAHTSHKAFEESVKIASIYEEIQIKNFMKHLEKLSPEGLREEIERGVRYKKGPGYVLKPKQAVKLRLADRVEKRKVKVGEEADEIKKKKVKKSS